MSNDSLKEQRRIQKEIRKEEKRLQKERQKQIQKQRHEEFVQLRKETKESLQEQGVTGEVLSSCTFNQGKGNSIIVISDDIKVKMLNGCATVDEQFDKLLLKSRTYEMIENAIAYMKENTDAVKNKGDLEYIIRLTPKKYYSDKGVWDIMPDTGNDSVLITGKTSVTVSEESTPESILKDLSKKKLIIGLTDNKLDELTKNIKAPVNEYAKYADHPNYSDCLKVIVGPTAFSRIKKNKKEPEIGCARAAGKGMNFTIKYGIRDYIYHYPDTEMSLSEKQKVDEGLMPLLQEAVDKKSEIREEIHKKLASFKYHLDLSVIRRDNGCVYVVNLTIGDDTHHDAAIWLDDFDAGLKALIDALGEYDIESIRNNEVNVLKSKGLYGDAVAAAIVTALKKNNTMLPANISKDLRGLKISSTREWEKSEYTGKFSIVNADYIDRKVNELNSAGLITTEMWRNEYTRYFMIQYSGSLKSEIMLESKASMPEKDTDPASWTDFEWIGYLSECKPDENTDWQKMLSILNHPAVFDLACGDITDFFRGMPAEFAKKLDETKKKKQKANTSDKSKCKCMGILIDAAKGKKVKTHEELEEEKEKRKLAKEQKELQLNRMFNDAMLKDPADAYPKARAIKRHFILHVGGTNSGKTHDALEDIINANSGLYLAPLRLLALEVQEKIMAKGVPCSMTTGEEDDFIENAKHLSCTIEKMDSAYSLGIYPDVAVIDEAQMISDKQRGWAWLKAILGLPCGKIHVCMSEDSLEIVKKLIEICNDTYEVVEHYRDTELEIERGSFSFPNDVADGDALVVFSKKNVLAIASTLEDKGIKTSVIYGALPYTARKNEIEKFRTGETKIVVCTDAIGMGVNLPIRRIVFMESDKFDGEERRYLNSQEIKQIAGRAGRKGIYPKGYVNALVDQHYIRHQLDRPSAEIKSAMIRIPEELLLLNMPLSKILDRWLKVPDGTLIKKANMDKEAFLCKVLEKMKFRNNTLTKDLEYRIASIPFDYEDERLYEVWEDLILIWDSGKNYSDWLPEIKNGTPLDSLEEKYRILDLIFSFVRTVENGDPDVIQRIRRERERASELIIQRLKEKKYHRRCNNCRKILPWNHPYGMCQECYEEMRASRYGYYGYDDDEDWY